MRGVASSVRTWAEMVRIEHSVFALPFALIATFLAGRNIEGRGLPYWGQIGLIVMCMVAARSVAMTFNRIVDAGIDARNPRTANRPIPSGRLSPMASWIMLVLSILTFGVACIGFHIFYGNSWPILLSGGVLLYLCGYSFTKRFTRWSHFYLGSAIALSPVAAWLAIDPTSIGLPALLLFGIVACWIGGFDVIYACQDIAVDRRDGLHSLPSKMGPGVALWIARAAHALVIVGLIVLGRLTGMGVIYAIGVGIVTILLVVENSLVRPNDYRHVNVAFFTINGVVSLILAVTTIGDMFL